MARTIDAASLSQQPEDKSLERRASQMVAEPLPAVTVVAVLDHEVSRAGIHGGRSVALL